MNKKDKPSIAPMLPDPDTLKKIMVTNRQEFMATKEYLKSRGDLFWYSSYGSQNSIIHNGKEFICVDVRNSGGKGHHLNRQFKKDIDAWLEENGHRLEKWPKDYKEQMINLDAIEKNIGKQGLAIDINDCYWKTGYKLTYSTQRTYVSGLKKKEWKDGRNACIGSLRKSKTFIPYLGGSPHYGWRPPPQKTPVEYEYIRNHIIGFVYQMFVRLHQEIGDGFHLFLTDCVFTDYKHKKLVEDFFASYGYTVKNKPIEFTKVDHGQRQVCWHDFRAEKFDDNGNLVGRGVDKYYYYSNHQLIGGTNQAEIDQNYKEIHGLH